MFAKRVKIFILALTNMTSKSLLAWERFPQHYPFQNNLFLENFIQSHPEMDNNRSYFFFHRNGLVLFIRYTSGKIPESIHIQEHFGEPIIDLTSGSDMASDVKSLGKAIDHFIKVSEKRPDCLYKFMQDIEAMDSLPDEKKSSVENRTQQTKSVDSSNASFINSIVSNVSNSHTILIKNRNGSFSIDLNRSQSDASSHLRLRISSYDGSNLMPKYDVTSAAPDKPSLESKSKSLSDSLSDIDENVISHRYQ